MAGIRAERAVHVLAGLGFGAPFHASLRGKTHLVSRRSSEVWPVVVMGFPAKRVLFWAEQ
jgi:hypothetical protein